MSKTLEYEKLINAFKSCTLCPLAQTRKQVVFGKGNFEARLAFVGEAPGETEDDGGEPFIGKAGEQFNLMLDAVGLKRSDLWITNTCLCRPKLTGVPGKNNRAPTPKEIVACNPRLRAELNIIRPEVVVLAGNTPLLMHSGLKGITKYRGWLDEWHGAKTAKVYATLHPASVLYGSTEQINTKKAWLSEDWKAIAGELNGKTPQDRG